MPSTTTINKTKPVIDVEAVKSVNVLTDRVQKRKKLWEESTPTVSAESSVLFTKAWKETEGLPRDLRWAITFSRRMAQIEPVIREGELIVSALTKHIKGVDIIAAFKPNQLIKQLEEKQFDRRLSSTAYAIIGEEDEKLLREDVKYWIKNMPPDYVNIALKEELGEDHFDLLEDRSMVLEGVWLRSEPERGVFQDYLGNWLGQPDVHDWVLDNGLNSIIAKAKAELEKMDMEGDHSRVMDPDSIHKHYLLRSIIISCEAVINWANRHGDLARKMAKKEKDPVRKKELEQIAEHCSWVPANPPRSFWEALQSFRFMTLAFRKEQPERPGLALGRLDQLLYSYYEKDIREGKITRQQAAELLCCLWLKVREIEVLQTQRRRHQIAPGTLLPNVTLGGRNEEGIDTTNELSWLILEITRQLKLSEPTLYIRYSDTMDEEFLIYALKANIDLEGGNPSFLNDTLGTNRFLARGVKLSEAVDWIASGCLGYHISCSEHAGGGMNLNQAKILEVTLNNGFDPRIGKQIGPKTGDVKKFTSIEQLYDAFFTQMDYFCDRMRKDYFIRRGLDMHNSVVSGYGTAMNEDSITSGKGPNEGGGRYAFCFNQWVGDRGISDVSDAFTAIKYLVFDKKKITMAELMDALKQNWEGKEDLRQECLKAPKYGNDDDYADDIFNYVSLTAQQTMLKRPDPFTGVKPFLFKGAAAGHIVQGFVVGALPNGRKAGTALNDGGLSAMPGMDVKGPTALINSATKVNHAWENIGIAFNMKFSKGQLNTRQKIANLLALLKTFFAHEGWHIQFNIHNAQDLIDAKLHPEKWKNLLVRVAGYSAYFVDLPESLQDEIIARTLHRV